jgi:DNA polymerase-4
MNAELDKIAATVFNRLQKHQIRGKTITLKIKYNDFRQVTRSQSFPEVIKELETLRTTARLLLAATDPEDKKTRLLGIGISNFGEAITKSRREGPTEQLTLF